MRAGIIITSLLGSTAAELIVFHDWVKNIAFVDHQGNEHIVQRLGSGQITLDYSLVDKEHDLTTFIVEDGAHTKSDMLHPQPICEVGRSSPGCLPNGSPELPEKRELHQPRPVCAGGRHYSNCWDEGTPKSVEKRGRTFGPCGDQGCIMEETPQAA